MSELARNRNGYKQAIPVVLGMKQKTKPKGIKDFIVIVGTDDNKEKDKILDRIAEIYMEMEQ